MSRSVFVPWDEALVGYDFGPEHPLNPLRVDLTMRLARDLGVLDLPNVTMVRPDPATDDELALVHDKEYVEAVKRAGDDPSRTDLARGLGTADTPTFRQMHEASALVVGATLTAARAVWSGEAEHAVNVAGGLHHAMPGAGSGFCVYNDPAVAIAWLLEQGAERIAYVDVDVHHGDGVERAFWDEPRVLTVSVHESGRYLFPGTGFPEDTGGTGGRGQCGEPRDAAGDDGRAVAARVPCRRAAAARGVPARRAGDPARLRQPRPRPVGAHGPDRRRTAHVVRRPARPGSPVRRGTVGCHRGWRLRAGAGRAAGLDASARGGRGSADAAGDTRPAGLARVRLRALRPGGAEPDDRRCSTRRGRTGLRATTLPMPSTARCLPPCGRSSRPTGSAGCSTCDRAGPRRAARAPRPQPDRRRRGHQP